MLIIDAIVDDMLQQGFFPAHSAFITIGTGNVFPCISIIDVKGFDFTLWSV
jgi:hypothetical protein